MKTNNYPTVKEWLSDCLNEPCRSSALTQLRSNFAELPVSNLLCALAYAFDWQTSREGPAYWADIAKKAKLAEARLDFIKNINLN